jgi:hypothetical protein
MEDSLILVVKKNKAIFRQRQRLSILNFSSRQITYCLMKVAQEMICKFKDLASE